MKMGHDYRGPEYSGPGKSGVWVCTVMKGYRKRAAEVSPFNITYKDIPVPKKRRCVITGEENGYLAKIKASVELGVPPEYVVMKLKNG